MALPSARPRSSIPVPIRSRSIELTPDGTITLSSTSAPSALSFLRQEKPRNSAPPSSDPELPTSCAIPAPSNAPAHWRGNEHALFKLSRSAKRDLQDYVLGRCPAQNKERNELTKPTGTKFVYVLQLDDAGDVEQGALCVPTNSTSLAGIYTFRDLNGGAATAGEPVPSTVTTNEIQTVTMRRLPRSRDTTSFAQLMASANEECFPLVDRELDADLDDNDGADQTNRPYRAPGLGVIAEEDKESNAVFVDVVDYIPPKYCRDPHFTGHPACLGRQKTDFYGFRAVDVRLELGQRFAMTHNGEDSPAHYRSWRIQKWDNGETMVHGQSSLRIEIPVEGAVETIVGNTVDDSDEELEDPSARFIRQLEAKHGPLTIANYLSSAQPQPEEVKCSEECLFKVNKCLGTHIEGRPGRPKYASVNDHISEPSVVFDGVDDLSDDHLAPPTRKPYMGPRFPEEELLEILNTPHEVFVEHYVQRQQALRERAAHAKRLSVDGDSALEAADPTTNASQTTGRATIEQKGSPLLLAVPGAGSAPIDETSRPSSAPTARSSGDSSLLQTSGLSKDALAVSPALAVVEPAALEVSLRPASALTSSSFPDEVSQRTSVFSKLTSVTTKPSNDGVGSSYLRTIDALHLDTEAVVCGAPFAAASTDKRVVSMPNLNSPALRTLSTDFSLSIRGGTTGFTTDAPATPLRHGSHAREGLSPIIEVQSPLQPSSELPSASYSRTINDDRAGAHLLPTELQLPDVGNWVEAVRQSQDQLAEIGMQGFSPLFDDLRVKTFRRRWSSKFKMSVKNWAQATSGATRRFVRATKKLGKTMRTWRP